MTVDDDKLLSVRDVCQAFRDWHEHLVLVAEARPWSAHGAHRAAGRAQEEAHQGPPVGPALLAERAAVMGVNDWSAAEKDLYATGSRAILDDLERQRQEWNAGAALDTTPPTRWSASTTPRCASSKRTTKPGWRAS